MNPDLYSELVKQINSLQKQVDGLIKPEVPVLTSWTATVTQSVAVAITSQVSYYVVFGPLVWVHTQIIVGAAGVAGNAISVGGQPAIMQAAANQTIIGEGNINDVSVVDYNGLVWIVGATDWRLRYGAGGSFVGAVPNFALASGDVIEYNCVFRRA